VNTNKPPVPLLVVRVALALLVVAGAARAQETPESAPISLELQGADVRDALRLVAKQGGLDLVMGSDVGGTISLELSEVTLQDALDAISRIGGFQHEIAGNVITVASLDELLERARARQEYERAAQEGPAPEQEVLVLQLQYVDAGRVAPVVEKLLGEGGTVTVLKTPDLLAQERRAADVRPADARNIQIGSRLSTTSQGQPARSHTLVVVDVPERLARIREVVAGLDVKPLQVLIEARFVEVSLDDDHKLGIDWNVIASATGAAAPHTFPFGNSTLGSFDPHVIGGSPGGIFPEAPDSVTTPAGPGLFTFGTLDFSSFAAVLEMIERDSRVEVVSNPRIVVGDRQTATILVGERFPILSATISEFGTVTETLDHYEPIGVQLEVTPSVLNDDEIDLFVRPSTSSLGQAVSGSSGLTVARINTRQIDTSVSCRDGQTVVLGGLITTHEERVTDKVPFLGSVPLLGRLFTHESTRLQRVDLVVFLTVTLLEEGLLGARDEEMLSRSAALLGGGDAAGGRARTPLEYSPAAPQY
jgi:type IV pilus assembly protein PilQ